VSVADPSPDPLIERLRRGDESAFRELVGKLHGPLRRLAASVVGSQAAAEEVVQDTWAAALEGLDQFEGRASLKTWLFRICVNRARSRREREQRMTPFSAFESTDAEGSAVDESSFDETGHWRSSPADQRFDVSPEGEQLRGELRDRLSQAVAALPERLRIVLTLRDVDGLSGEEVCNVLEITESNQRVLLHRARTKVRAALAIYLNGPDAPETSQRRRS
jgi:RNA polymerase sigma-70 factor (ECF subfamily)